MDRNDHLTRRHFLKHTALASFCALTASTFGPGSAHAEEVLPVPPHGALLRGMTLPLSDPNTEGRFGYMFKGQPPMQVDQVDPRLLTDLLKGLGAAMQEQPGVSPSPTTAEFEANDKANELPASTKLTSGWTFFGQFLDHDITFDQTPLGEQQADPEATTNFRTPRYDLDSVYGRGPSANPQFYDPTDRAKLRVVRRTATEPILTDKGTFTVPITVEDLPRAAATDPRDDQVYPEKALLADPRNDQHVIIAQLHVAFMKFHNRLVDYCRSTLRLPLTSVFEEARRLARWHYQWIVIHDFLPRIADPAIVKQVYNDALLGLPLISLKYYMPLNLLDRAFIPLEFAVAAYRFGHSITRPRYTIQDITNGATVLGAVRSVPLFEDVPSDNNLNGSRTIPGRLKVQWSKFFNDRNLRTGADLVSAKPARKIDAMLSDALFRLPTTAIPDGNLERLLAVRNLLRGQQMRLPSGQRLAQLMNVRVLSNEELGHTALPASDANRDPYVGATITDPAWMGEAPLWFYILKEAQLLGKGERLGPVGSRIVAEVLVGLLQRDLTSYLYLNPLWRPQRPLARVAGTFTMVDLLRFAGAWS